MTDLMEEMGISDLYKKYDTDCHRAKRDTMCYTHLGASGNVVAENCAALDALQAKIADLEAGMTAANAEVVAIRGDLSSVGADSIADLNERHRTHSNIIRDRPNQAMELFQMKVSLAHEKGQMLTAMPSELPALLDGYQAEEDTLKAELDASLAALPALTTARESISSHIGTARHALSGH